MFCPLMRTRKSAPAWPEVEAGKGFAAGMICDFDLLDGQRTQIKGQMDAPTVPTLPGRLMVVASISRRRNKPADAGAKAVR
jgi:hypothetical protein